MGAASGPGEGRVAPSDAYEASEMVARGRVLLRDKAVSRAMALAMAGLGTVFTALSVALLLGIDPRAPALARWASLALPMLFWFAALARSVLRTLVTTEEVQVDMGFLKARVPVAAITACAVVPVTRATSAGARAFVPHVQGEAVRVDYVDAEGRARAVLIGAGDPQRVAAAIEQARRERGGTGVRVDADEATAAARASAVEAVVGRGGGEGEAGVREQAAREARR